MKQPWFSNKGQIIQIGLQILIILIGLKLWPEMSANHMLTGGALLFYLLMGMAILATVINVAAAHKSSSRTAPPPIPRPTLSSADQSLLDKVRDDLHHLGFERRTALRLVYCSPGQFAGVYCRQLEALGFPDGEKIIKQLISSTVLVGSSPQMRLSQSPHKVIEQLVEDEMAKPGWAGI
jgi:hypothetical protein